MELIDKDDIVVVRDEMEKILSFLGTIEVKEVNFKDAESVFEGQYFSKDKVVTTIERLQDECEKQGDNNGVELLEKLFNKLDTIEVKEVDLEKEFDSFAYTLPRSATGYGPFDKHFDDPKIIEARNHGWRHSWSYKEALKIAKHFFELGLKAQKDLTV